MSKAKPVVSSCPPVAAMPCWPRTGLCWQTTRSYSTVAGDLLVAQPTPRRAGPQAEPGGDGQLSKGGRGTAAPTVAVAPRAFAAGAGNLSAVAGPPPSSLYGGRSVCAAGTWPLRNGGAAVGPVIPVGVRSYRQTGQAW